MDDHSFTQVLCLEERLQHLTIGSDCELLITNCVLDSKLEDEEDYKLLILVMIAAKRHVNVYPP